MKFVKREAVGRALFIKAYGRFVTLDPGCAFMDNDTVVREWPHLFSNSPVRVVPRTVGISGTPSGRVTEVRIG